QSLGSASDSVSPSLSDPPLGAHLASTMCAAPHHWRSARSMHKDTGKHTVNLEKDWDFVCIFASMASQ
uniref:Uncharacterized protein n=1 Tax=Suricata suricatta TaxID=37032 RepID=A0A673VED5_SURSU